MMLFLFYVRVTVLATLLAAGSAGTRVCRASAAHRVPMVPDLRLVDDPDARRGRVTVPFEQVILWNPEVILTTDPNFWTFAATEPRWRAVEAVSRRQVFLSPHLPFGWFDCPPSANRLLGIWWAGKLLHPAAFDFDLRATSPDDIQLLHVVSTPRRLRAPKPAADSNRLGRGTAPQSGPSDENRISRSSSTLQTQSLAGGVTRNTAVHPAIQPRKLDLARPQRPRPPWTSLLADSSPSAGRPPQSFLLPAPVSPGKRRRLP